MAALHFVGVALLLVGMASFVYGSACLVWERDHPRELPTIPQPTLSTVPLSDAMRDAIRRDVSDAIMRDARTRRAHDIHARHELGLGVRETTIDALIGTKTVDVGEMK